VFSVAELSKGDENEPEAEAEEKPMENEENGEQDEAAEEVENILSIV